MLRFRWLISTFPAAIVLSASAVRAQEDRSRPPTHDEAIEQLKTLETRWGQAVVERDTATLGQMVADEFEGIYPTRRLTRRDMLVSVAFNPPPGARRMVGSPPDATKNIRVYGNTAVVTGSAVQNYQEENGRSSTVRTVYTEVFVWRNGRWQAVSGHYTPLLTPN